MDEMEVSSVLCAAFSVHPRLFSACTMYGVGLQYQDNIFDSIFGVR